MPASAKRRLYLRVTAKLLGLAALAAFAITFVAGLVPRQGPSPALTAVDVAALAPGAVMRLEWGGHRVVILHRTGEMVARLPQLAGTLLDPESHSSEQPRDRATPLRAASADFFVALDYDPDFGCPLEFVPAAGPAAVTPWVGGFRAPCSNSWFDPAGRVYEGQRTTHNLRVPPHRFEAGRLLLGE